MVIYLFNFLNLIFLIIKYYYIFLLWHGIMPQSSVLRAPYLSLCRNFQTRNRFPDSMWSLSADAYIVWGYCFSKPVVEKAILSQLRSMAHI